MDTPVGQGEAGSARVVAAEREVVVQDDAIFRRDRKVADVKRPAVLHRVDRPDHVLGGTNLNARRRGRRALGVPGSAVGPVFGSVVGVAFAEGQCVGSAVGNVAHGHLASQIERTVGEDMPIDTLVERPLDPRLTGARDAGIVGRLDRRGTKRAIVAARAAENVGDKRTGKKRGPAIGLGIDAMVELGLLKHWQHLDVPTDARFPFPLVLSSSGWELLRPGVVRVESQRLLLEIILTLRAPRGFAGRLYGWKEQPDQQTDDRHHDEQLDERESVSHFRSSKRGHRGVRRTIVGQAEIYQR